MLGKVWQVLFIAYLAMRSTAQIGTLCTNGHADAGSKSTDLLITQQHPPQRPGKTYGTTMVTESLCASHWCTLISCRNNSHNTLCREPTARKLKACTYRSARAGCLPKVKPEEDRQERVPDVIATLNSHSSWVCRYHVAQMLDRHKVQRIASERVALNSRCLSRHGCMLYHHMHHAAASLYLDMLMLSHTRSAAQQQVWSCKTTAAAEACKTLLLLLYVSVSVCEDALRKMRKT